jgi:hypothetical protein
MSQTVLCHFDQDRIPFPLIDFPERDATVIFWQFSFRERHRHRRYR